MTKIICISENVPEEAVISDTFQVFRPNGVLWIFFVKSDGYEMLPNHGSWRYVFIPNDRTMPLTDGGYPSPKAAMVEWLETEERREALV